jgi:hypothetical protein
MQLAPLHIPTCLFKCNLRRYAPAAPPAARSTLTRCCGRRRKPRISCWCVSLSRFVHSRMDFDLDFSLVYGHSVFKLCFFCGWSRISIFLTPLSRHHPATCHHDIINHNTDMSPSDTNHTLPFLSLSLPPSLFPLSLSLSSLSPSPVIPLSLSLSPSLPLPLPFTYLLTYLLTD